MSSLARPCPPGPPPVAFPSNLRCGFVAEHLSIINSLPYIYIYLYIYIYMYIIYCVPCINACKYIHIYVYIYIYIACDIYIICIWGNIYLLIIYVFICRTDFGHPAGLRMPAVGRSAGQAIARARVPCKQPVHSAGGGLQCGTIGQTQKAMGKVQHDAI